MRKTNQIVCLKAQTNNNCKYTTQSRQIKRPYVQNKSTHPGVYLILTVEYKADNKTTRNFISKIIIKGISIYLFLHFR